MPSKKPKKKRRENDGRGRNLTEEPDALNRARAVLDSALDCMITMDATGRAREFNSVAERVFGFSRTEAIGEELAKLLFRRGCARDIEKD